MAFKLAMEISTVKTAFFSLRKMTMEISNVICQNVNTMEIYNVILGKSSSLEWNGNQQREDTFISSKYNYDFCILINIQ